MNIGVTFFALLWRGVEISISELGFKVGGLVAVNARDSTMRSDQREIRLGVVEARQIHPGFVSVASFASHGLAVHDALHTFPELPAVRIGVTSRAGPVLEVIRDRWLDLRGSLGWGLMALPAGHRQVRSDQHEP
jgi:hypothetical protein